MKYNDGNRGKYQNESRARQLIRFEGLRFNNITPTDIDLFMEYHDKAFVIAEIKHRDAEMPRGQQLALTRVVDRIAATSAEAVLFYCIHQVDNTDDDVYAAQVFVRGVYYKGVWYKSRKRTLKDAITSFLNFIKARE